MPDDPVHELALSPLGQDAWRLCDPAISASDAENVIAYVEQSAVCYGVTWVHGGFGTAWFDTMDEVMAAAATHVPECASRRRKPVPIPHRPPLGAI